ncbi:hypothetical protein M2142_002376 [Fusobacterium sp. PH5-29]|uniref:hypothetical protein n=1 Tax=Fusobacterium sp. PH5-29 TaxID=1742400 RepID=UPI003D1C1C57
MYNARDGKGDVIFNGGQRIKQEGVTISSGLQFGYVNENRDIKATIGNGVITNFDTQGVNRDIEKAVSDWQGTNIETFSVNLLTEYWLTQAGRGSFRDQVDEFRESSQKFKAEIIKIKEKIINKDKLSVEEGKKYLFDKSLDDISFSMKFDISDEEIEEFLSNLKQKYREEGINIEQQSPENLVRGIIWLSEQLEKGIKEGMSEKDLDSLRGELIIAHCTLREKDKGYENLAKDINAKIFFPILESDKYDKISSQWTQLYNDNEKGKNNQVLNELYNEYITMFKEQAQSAYGLNYSNTEFLIVHAGETNVKLFGKRDYSIDSSITGANIYNNDTGGASFIINLNQKEYSNFYNIHTTNKHESGWHYIIRQIFSEEANSMTNLMEKFKLENFKAVYLQPSVGIIMEGERKKMDKNMNMNIMLYLNESEEAGARYFEKLK